MAQVAGGVYGPRPPARGELRYARVEMTEEQKPAPRVAIPLPGGKVARVPVEVLMQYVEEGARAAHAGEPDDADVTAHDLQVDASTGVSDFHTDWEQGDCYWDDGSGTAQRIYAWHRHPFGTEYTEIWEG